MNPPPYKEYFQDVSINKIDPKAQGSQTSGKKKTEL